MRAAVEEAAAQGKPVAAHAHAAAGIRHAVQAGVASIEHGTFADGAALELMASRGTFLVPTLCATSSMLRDVAVREAMPEHLRARLSESQTVHQDAVRRAVLAGVPVAMGTDAGTPGNHHGANADEVVAMVEEAGLTPRQSIYAATAGAARLLRRQNDMGSLEPGTFADVIGLPADPLEDIAAITRVVFVMKGGWVVRDDR
jgi:imidazolonepropionase-like amidohydrolase